MSDTRLNSARQNGQTKSQSKKVEYWEQKFPPINQLCLASLTFIIIDGIYIAAHLPNLPSMLIVTTLLGLGGVLALFAAIWLSQIKNLAWDKFFKVFRWVILEYVVEAGMLEYIFIYDHVRGQMLVILTLALILFAIDIPIIMSFTAARFQS
jgi:hypothetical protein